MLLRFAQPVQKSVKNQTFPTVAKEYDENGVTFSKSEKQTAQKKLDTIKTRFPLAKCGKK